MHKKHILTTLALLFVAFAFLQSPEKYMGSVTHGLQLWYHNVLPALLPFLIVTGILMELDAFAFLGEKMSFFGKLLGTPKISAGIFLSSALAGYPMGAKLTEQCFLDGQIDKNQSKQLLTFCSTSGPVFVIGSVGVNFFDNANFGLALFACHLVSALLCGLVFKSTSTQMYCTQSLPFSFKATPSIRGEKKGVQFQEIISKTSAALIFVGVTIAFFSMVIDMTMSLLPVQSQPLSALLAGSIEMTRGLQMLSSLPNTNHSFVLCGFLLSFGGLCILMQTYGFLGKTGVSMKFLLLSKLIQSALNTLVCFAFVSVFPF